MMNETDKTNATKYTFHLANGGAFSYIETDLEAKLSKLSYQDRQSFHIRNIGVNKLKHIEQIEL